MAPRIASPTTRAREGRPEEVAPDPLGLIQIGIADIALDTRKASGSERGACVRVILDAGEVREARSL